MLLLSCVTLGGLFPLCVPQFPHLRNGDYPHALCTFTISLKGSDMPLDM